MLKMFSPAGPAGSEATFWEETWQGQSLEEAVRQMANQPLRPLWDRYFLVARRVLEGGCGMGQVVAYYRRQGCAIVGLDFAFQTLRRLKQYDATVPVCCGDVTRLPYLDSAFDVYYSGGVVEHLESGCLPALREAYRVLRPGGTLLISVPYFNLLRQVLFWGRARLRRSRDGSIRVGGLRVAAAGAERFPARPDLQFFQYAYSRREFASLLEQTGFHVCDSFGFSVVWGLMELDLAEKCLERCRPRATVSAPPRGEGTDAYTSRSPRLLRLARQVLLYEQPESFWLQLLLGVLRRSVANMRMYVCEKPY